MGNDFVKNAGEDWKTIDSWINDFRQDLREFLEENKNCVFCKNVPTHMFN